MRKRAQRKSIPLDEKQSSSERKPISKPRMPQMNKKWWTAVSLVAIFLLVLFLTSYFNVTSGAPFNPEGTGFDKYYLSGPDPYYNMRIVDQTLYGQDPGHYPFYSENDPLLNYPLGRSGARGPLMNMMAIMFGQMLTPFMDEIDAVGYAMQFIPALFGALLVFPIYYIGKTLFNRKTGLLAALFIAFIPIHLGSGHGSAYSLFDHDSLNLLLMVTTYAFLMKALREKDTIKSMLYSVLAGMPLAALSMVWVEARFLYTVIAIYAIVQMLIDIYQSRIELKVPRSISITMFTGFLLSAPVLAARTSLISGLPFYLCIGVAAFGALYYFFKMKDLPWTLSLPMIAVVGIGGAIFLYFIPSLKQSFPFLGGLSTISGILFGTGGIYANKVSMTIAEAGTYGISRTVMSFGPALFWIAWIGFVFVGYYYLKSEHRRDHLFLLILFIIGIWFVSVAGRFMNDLVPVVALFGAWLVVYIIDRINYPAMIKRIRGVGGGLHGIRRGIGFIHIVVVVIIALLVVFPNAYLSLDAAVPATYKEEVFGDLPNGAFGSSFGKEQYWTHAFSWFSQQDTDIQNPVERPAFISWWDYGFYEVAIGGHPTVADNFQDGIPPAGNFHIATSEQAAVAIWIIRLLEGNAFHNNGALESNVKDVLRQHLNDTDANRLINWVEYPEQSPSYGTPIAQKYTSNGATDYPVGQQWPMNAVYHDGSDMLLDMLSDEEITMLYRDIQDATGTSIRYYGVEGYDKQIFNIFGFLADRSLLLVAGMGDAKPEDDYVEIKYVTQNGVQLSYDELMNRTDSQNRLDPIVDTRSVYKPAYYDTMFYRTYVGVVNDQEGTLSEPDYQIPCLNMRHFYAQYISPYPEYAYYQGKSAVVIAKYYEGAVINGSVLFDDETRDFKVVVQQNIFHYGSDVPVDHDSVTTVNGSYQVIVPAGVSTIQVIRYPELGDNAFEMANVTFDAEDIQSPLAPITEAEATRKGPYTRTIDITIEPGDIQGYVYQNNDNDTAFNASIDSPLEDVTVTLYGIDSIDETTGQPDAYDFTMIQTVTSDGNGFYSVSDLMPGYYQIIATTPDGFQIDNTLYPVYGGNNTYDIAEPKSGDAEGTIFFDDNGNGQYDAGEEMTGAKVDLIYTMTGEGILVDTITTDETGRYSFSDLVRGVYDIHVTKLPAYDSTQEITIQEDKTTTLNVSVQYAKVAVTGVTRDKDTMVAAANISMTFAPDITVENNTAAQATAKSDALGKYTVSLMPGAYNVTVLEKVIENGINVSYSYSGQLALSIGQGSKTYDVLLTRVED